MKTGDQIIQIGTLNGATTKFSYDDLGNQLEEIGPAWVQTVQLRPG